MKVIKLGIISLVVFALMITGISLFFPSRVRISKAIDINAARDSVMRQVTDPVNWKSWYPGTDTSDYLYIEGKVKGFTTGNMRGLMIKTVTDSSVIAGNVGTDAHSRKCWYRCQKRGAGLDHLQFFNPQHCYRTVVYGYSPEMVSLGKIFQPPAGKTIWANA